MKRLSSLVVTLALAAFAAGCGGNTNTTNNTSNATMNGNANANANSNANANTSANANKGDFDAGISQADFEKAKDDFTKRAKDLGDRVGTGLTDGWLWVKTRGALMAADDLEESGINVDVSDGVITLRGMVPNQDQVKKADTVAKGVSGSKGVQNQLKVGAGGGNTNAPTK